MKTETQFATQIERCRKLFYQKTIDYGTSWRILRLPSITDQIFIKANRIRGIQENGEHLVEEGQEPEFVAMVNYGIMALMQQELAGDERQELPIDEVMPLYDKHIAEATALMLNKNHDYGEAWRQMRVSSITDIILMKLRRLKQIEDNNGHTLVSEGVSGNYTDIINYSLFCLIKLDEESEKNK